MNGITGTGLLVTICGVGLAIILRKPIGREIEAYRVAKREEREKVVLHAGKRTYLLNGTPIQIVGKDSETGKYLVIDEEQLAFEGEEAAKKLVDKEDISDYEM